MNRERALFVTSEALESSRSPDGLSPLVTGFLRDHAAQGYRVLVVTDRLQLGEWHYDSKVHMLQAVRTCERHLLPISDILHLGDAYDPTPFWDAARRFNLSLAHSILVSSHGELAGAARNAGVHKTEPSGMVFGLAA